LKISIITVSYNSAATIEQSILSVANQNYPHIEYIVVDGQSTDGTLDIIEKHKETISKFISEKDLGIYDALNKGIDLASGEVIGILHSDDMYTDAHVISKYATLFSREQTDAVYSNLYYVDRKHSDKIIRKWHSGIYNKGAFYNGWMPPHPTFFVKKEIYKRLGNFNLSFRIAADYELMLRFIEKNGITLSYLDEYTVKMRTGGKSNVSLKNRIAANIEDRRAWRVNGLKPKFYTLFLKPFRKIIQYL
jgi:glycosyltransferase involved in cell wall biosynthesis